MVGPMMIARPGLHVLFCHLRLRKKKTVEQPVPVGNPAPVSDDLDETLPVDIQEWPTPSPPPSRIASSDDVEKKRRKYQNLTSDSMGTTKVLGKWSPAITVDESTCTPASTRTSGAESSGSGGGGGGEPQAVEVPVPKKRLRRKAPSSFAIGEPTTESKPLEANPDNDAHDGADVPEVLHCKK